MLQPFALRSGGVASVFFVFMHGKANQELVPLQGFTANSWKQCMQIDHEWLWMLSFEVFALNLLVDPWCYKFRVHWVHNFWIQKFMEFCETQEPIQFNPMKPMSKVRHILYMNWQKDWGHCRQSIPIAKRAFRDGIPCGWATAILQRWLATWKLTPAAGTPFGWYWSWGFTWWRDQGEHVHVKSLFDVSSQISDMRNQLSTVYICMYIYTLHLASTWSCHVKVNKFRVESSRECGSNTWTALIDRSCTSLNFKTKTILKFSYGLKGCSLSVQSLWNLRWSSNPRVTTRNWLFRGVFQSKIQCPVACSFSQGWRPSSAAEGRKFGSFMKHRCRKSITSKGMERTQWSTGNKYLISPLFGNMMMWSPKPNEKRKKYIWHVFMGWYVLRSTINYLKVSSVGRGQESTLGGCLLPRFR